MPKIFISYRRNDVRQLANQIYTGLIQHFPKEDVFMDVDSIQYGANFLASIERHVIFADVVLALIGPYWNGQPGERRLMDQSDFVRRELELALRHQKRLLPILIGSWAQFPPQADLPPSLERLPFLNALRFPTTFSQREQYQLVSVILTPPQPQVTLPNTPLAPQSVTPIVPTSPNKLTFVYGQYRIVIPARIYSLYENGAIYWISIFSAIIWFAFFIITPSLFSYHIPTGFFGSFLAVLYYIIYITLIFTSLRIPALGLAKFRGQLLKIAQMSPRGDERGLIRLQMEQYRRYRLQGFFLNGVSHRGRSLEIFSWYQEYCRNPLDSKYAPIRQMSQQQYI